MARIKIKKTKNKSHDRKRKLLEILSQNEIYVTRILNANDGYIILISNDGEMDKIFNGITERKLRENDFTPVISPQLEANRSILIFRVDNHIFQNEETKMKEEIK